MLGTTIWRVVVVLAGVVLSPRLATAQPVVLPTLHHVGLNSVDPERAIAWYLRLWPTATRTEVAGQPGVQAEMLLLFERVGAPPAGAWRDDLRRPEAQSPFWHIGAFTNTSTLPARLEGTGVSPLPLWTSPTDTIGVWRSGLAPYAGTRTAMQLATAPPAAPAEPPREGGFAYVVAPDGALFEFTGGAGTRDAFAHLHFFHEQPLCAANWYVMHLGMALPPVRDSAGGGQPRPLYSPCEVSHGEAGWPSLERVGTIRQPSGGVRYANGSMAWYPRQCLGDRCGAPQRLVPSRGQVLDHVAFGVRDLQAMHDRLRRAGVRIIEPIHPFGATRAFMIEDPDGLAVELVELP